MRVCVIGQGYVGTSIGLAAHKSGHQVVGIETDSQKIQTLHHLGYPVSDSYEQARNSEIVIIAVPTPLDVNRLPDISFIESACQSLKKVISGGTLVINESTSFPGTVRKIIAPILGSNLLYASAPERVDPGNSSWNIKNTPRLVGGLTPEAASRAVNFYITVCDSVQEVSSPEVAEAAKLFENTFRQVNIALVNEFAIVANALGISVFETLGAAATKPFGFMKFLPGIGVGGHCIPVDPIYLSSIAEEYGIEAKFIQLANHINNSMTSYVIDRIDKDFGIEGKKIQIAGISYKPNIADTRESPALNLITGLRNKGGLVTWHDNLVEKLHGESSQPLNPNDLGIICTAHSNINYEVWKSSNMNVINLTHEPIGDWYPYL